LGLSNVGKESTIVPMRKRDSIFPAATFFSLLSLGIVFISLYGYTTFITKSISFFTIPAQRMFFSMTLPFFQHEKPSQKVFQNVLNDVGDSENKKEMQALRDQFETSEPRPLHLIPGRIIGYIGFIPGVKQPLFITLDKGTRDGVELNQAVVYENNVIGKISKVTPYASSVMLLTNPDLSFTTETITNGATGIVHGGQPIVMDNVVLSEALEKDEIVVTKGDIDLSGSGFPPNLVVGKIVSTEKQPSALFHSAQLQSLVAVTSLTTVFILTN